MARELLAALETATIPGQHYLMDKVIDLLGGEPLRANTRLADWQRQTNRPVAPRAGTGSRPPGPRRKRFRPACRDADGRSVVDLA